MSVGEASIGLNLGTAQLDSDTKKAEQILNRIGRGVIANGAQAEKAINQLASVGITSVDRLQRSFNTLNIKSGLDIDKEKARLTAAFEQIKRSGVASADEIKRAHESMKSKMDSLGGSASGATNMFERLGAASLAAFAGFSVQQVITQLHTAGMAAERLRNSFEAATGSIAKGASEYGYARAESQRLGLDLQVTADAYLKLTASAKGTTLEGEKTRDIFSAVAGAGRALGLSGDQMGGALLAISQMMSKGTVQAEELRGQLGERLPGAFNIAARAMGVSTSELGKMLEQGKVVAEDFLPKFAVELQKTFPAGEKAMAGMTAETARLKTAWFELKTTVMDAGGESMFTGSIKGMKDLVVEADTFYARMSSAWKLLKDFAKSPMNPRLGATDTDTRKLAPFTAFDKAMTGIPDIGGNISDLNNRIKQPKLKPVMIVDQEARNYQEEESKKLKKEMSKKGKTGLTDEQKGYQAEIKKFLKGAWDSAATELAAEDFSKDINKKLGLVDGKTKNNSKSKLSMGVDTRLKSVDEVAADQKAADEKLAIEKRLQGDLLNVKMSAASHGLDILRQTAGEGTAIGIAALVAQKALTVANILMSTHASAAAATMMPPIGLGPVAGQALAAEITAMGYVSAGLAAAAGAIELGQTVSGKRALGGPVSSGKTYLVGEKGPELFTPGSDGGITPNNKLGGQSVVIRQSFSITGVGADIMANTKAVAKQAADRAKAEILNSMNRGGEFALASGRMK